MCPNWFALRIHLSLFRNQPCLSANTKQKGQSVVCACWCHRVHLVDSLPSADIAVHPSSLSLFVVEVRRLPPLNILARYTSVSPFQSFLLSLLFCSSCSGGPGLRIRDRLPLLFSSRTGASSAHMPDVSALPYIV